MGYVSSKVAPVDVHGHGGVVTRLVDALEGIGLKGEISSSGRWAKLQGERCPVYVVEAAWSTRFYTWCDHPDERVVEVYNDAESAIRAGLRRAAREK